MVRRIDVTGAGGVSLAAWEFADPPKTGEVDQSPGVLLLHGLMGRASHWAGTARWLSERHRAVALDQRGHGQSQKPPRAPTTARRTSRTPRPPSSSSASRPPSSSATPWARSPPGSSPRAAPTSYAP